MNEREYAAMMIEAQRAAFNALKGSAPIMNTVGGAPVGYIMDSKVTTDAIAKIEKMGHVNDAYVNQRYQEKVKKMEKKIPTDLRIRATYTPIVMRELMMWLCCEAARILKLSDDKESMPYARELRVVVNDYEKMWLLEYDKSARDSLKWLMRDWVSMSLGAHVEMLKSSYLYVVNNGDGPKYVDQNARDLIAWMMTVCALGDEVLDYDTEKIKEINKVLKGSGQHIEHKPRKSDYTYAFVDYADGVLHRFGYRKEWTGGNVEMAKKVVRNQMRMYDPQARIDEYERLLEQEQDLLNKKKIVL